MWQLFLKFCPWTTTWRIPKYHPYSTSRLLVSGICMRQTCIPWGGFIQRFRREIYVFLIKHFNKAFLCSVYKSCASMPSCGQIMCAEHDFVPGKYFKPLGPKRYGPLYRKRNPGSGAVWTVALLQRPHQLLGTVGFLRWSNQPCERRHSPRAACSPPRGSGRPYFRYVRQRRKMMRDGRRMAGGWRRWVRVNVLGRCRTIVWSPFFSWSWRF
jgi:hypothetical protein